MSEYRLEHRRLAVECKNTNDEAWALVTAVDSIYLTRTEVPWLRANKNINLFKYFTVY
jgi:hypothetical protein